MSQGEANEVTGQRTTPVTPCGRDLQQSRRQGGRLRPHPWGRRRHWRGEWTAGFGQNIIIPVPQMVEMVSGLKKESQGERERQSVRPPGRSVGGILSRCARFSDPAVFLRTLLTGCWSGITDKSASVGCVVIGHCIGRRLNCLCRFNLMFML